MIIRKYKPSDCTLMSKLFYYTVHTINAKDYTYEQLKQKIKLSETALHWGIIKWLRIDDLQASQNEGESADAAVVKSEENLATVNHFPRLGLIFGFVRKAQNG